MSYNSSSTSSSKVCASYTVGACWRQLSAERSSRQAHPVYSWQCVWLYVGCDADLLCCCSFLTTLALCVCTTCCSSCCCSEELVARFRRSVQDPNLLPGSIPATLRDEFGADSDVVTDNLIMVIFAGFETSTSLAVRLLYHLAQQPDVVAKVCLCLFVCMRDQRGEGGGGRGGECKKSWSGRRSHLAAGRTTSSSTL